MAFSEGVDTLLKTSQTKHRSCLGSYETLNSSCEHPSVPSTCGSDQQSVTLEAISSSLPGQDVEMKGVFILFYKNIPHLLRVLFLAPALSNVDGSPFTSVPLRIL